VLLDHVVVVEQPFARGADVEPAVGAGGEPVVGVLQDGARAGEPGEERGPPSPPGGRQPLAGGEVLRPLGEVLGPEQLAADRAGEEVLPPRGAGL
jgi:hypothetical protein